MYVYLDPSLGGEEQDLAADTRDIVIPKWNALAARNPHLVTCNCQYFDIMVEKVTLSAGVYGSSGMPHTNAIPSLFTSGITKLATGIVWNHSLTCPDATHCDSRAVVSHEFGHEEGLGHTGYSNSVMGGIYYTPQPNDLAGIQHIYGAYP